MLDRLREAGVKSAALIGSVKGAGTGRIALATRGERPLAEAKRALGPAAEAIEPAGQTADCCVEPEAAELECCAEGPAAPSTPAIEGTLPAQAKFREFLKAAGQPGALDAATKQALAIALAVITKCEPCAKIHIRKAREMGFTQEEIDEAAWCAISFGGSPVMMFYNGVRDS